METTATREEEISTAKKGITFGLLLWAIPVGIFVLLRLLHVISPPPLVEPPIESGMDVAILLGNIFASLILWAVALTVFCWGLVIFVWCSGYLAVIACINMISKISKGAR